ncbi:MAG: carboxypeptidase regulatory-like domain-containing protein [Acidobacteriota bacterium]
MRSRGSLFLLAVALIAVLPGLALAQTYTGHIYGVVVDDTGAVIPGVTVDLTGTLIGTMTQSTGVTGEFHFIRLSPGDYDLECGLQGFATYVQKQISVQTGSAVNLRITMKPSAVVETVTVTAEQPILDTKKTGVGQNVSNEMLANIPTARDPWVVMSMISGVVVDRVNIAGSEGGQQSTFTSRGDVGGNNTMWNMDGVNITDMASVGATTTYFDFDAIEEMEITTGGNDPSQPTGGLGLNFVTKRGGDIPKGSARFITTSEGLQSDNTKDLATPQHGGSTELDGYKWNPEFQRVSLTKLRDYGIEIGGPIVKEKAWYWGAVGIQDIQTTAINGAPDNTLLENISLKFNAQATEGTSLTYFYFRGDKIKRGRSAGATRPIETTYNQDGPTDIHKVEASHIFNQDLYLNAKFSYLKSVYHLVPAGGLDAERYRTEDGVWHGTYDRFDASQPAYTFTADTNYFVRALGGSHEFKFGFSYRRFTNESSTRIPGDMLYADAYYGIVWIMRDSSLRSLNQYTSFYAGDTFTKGRLTANLGLRFDSQSGTILDTSVRGNAAYPAILPSISVPTQDAPFTWNNISPRLGVTYDLTGDGKTLARASFAQYADQLGVKDYWLLSPVTYPGELDYYWTDLNGDHLAQDNEIDWAYGPVGIYYVDPLDPTSNRSTTVVDGDLTAPKRLEFIVGGEREIVQNFSVGGNFVWRKAYNLTWKVGTDYKNPNAPYTFSDYELAGNVTGTLPDGTAYNMPYWGLRDARAELPGAGIDSLYTNREDYGQKYLGMEFFATKRLSNKWMLNASFNYQTDREYFDGTAGMADPTNLVDGGNLVTISGSGKTDYWVGTPKWQMLMNGMYQLPYGLSASGNLIAREGFPIVYFQRESRVDPGSSGKNVWAQEIGETKMPNVIELDLRVSKAISLGEKGNVSLDLDVFNVLNKNTPLAIAERLDSSSANQVQDLMYPRVVRFGVRYSF